MRSSEIRNPKSEIQKEASQVSRRSEFEFRISDLGFGVSVDCPDAGRRPLEQVLVRVAEVEADAPRRPGHSALERHAVLLEPCFPPWQFFARDGEGQVQLPAAVIGWDDAP